MTLLCEHIYGAVAIAHCAHVLLLTRGRYYVQSIQALCCLGLTDAPTSDLWFCPFCIADASRRREEPDCPRKCPATVKMCARCQQIKVVATGRDTGSHYCSSDKCATGLKGPHAQWLAQGLPPNSKKLYSTYSHPVDKAIAAGSNPFSLVSTPVGQPPLNAATATRKDGMRTSMPVLAPAPAAESGAGSRGESPADQLGTAMPSQGHNGASGSGSMPVAQILIAGFTKCQKHQNCPKQYRHLGRCKTVHGHEGTRQPALSTGVPGIEADAPPDSICNCRQRACSTCTLCLRCACTCQGTASASLGAVEIQRPHPTPSVAHAADAPKTTPRAGKRKRAGKTSLLLDNTSSTPHRKRSSSRHHSVESAGTAADRQPIIQSKTNTLPGRDKKRVLQQPNPTMRCASCGHDREPAAFSKSQKKKLANNRRCKPCANAANGDGVDRIVTARALGQKTTAPATNVPVRRSSRRRRASAPTTVAAQVLGHNKDSQQQEMNQEQVKSILTPPVLAANLLHGQQPVPPPFSFINLILQDLDELQGDDIGMGMSFEPLAPPSVLSTIDTTTAASHSAVGMSFERFAPFAPPSVLSTTAATTVASHTAEERTSPMQTRTTLRSLDKLAARGSNIEVAWCQQYTNGQACNPIEDSANPSPASVPPSTAALFLGMLDGKTMQPLQTPLAATVAPVAISSLLQTSSIPNNQVAVPSSIRTNPLAWNRQQVSDWAVSQNFNYALLDNFVDGDLLHTRDCNLRPCTVRKCFVCRTLLMFV